MSPIAIIILICLVLWAFLEFYAVIYCIISYKFKIKYRIEKKIFKDDTPIYNPQRFNGLYWKSYKVMKTRTNNLITEDYFTKYYCNTEEEARNIITHVWKCKDDNKKKKVIKEYINY